MAFRDYTIAHPEVAQKYSELKRELAKKYPEDIQCYMNGKNGFIKEVEKKALEWQNLNLTGLTHSDKPGFLTNLRVATRLFVKKPGFSTPMRKSC